LSDQVREPRNYAAVLKAIGQGNHILDEITLAAGLGSKQHASTYLSRLQGLYLVKREIWAAVRCVLFARSGCTEAAVAEVEQVGALLVGLDTLGRGLDAEQ
jgi:hypothetical protein